MVPSGLVVQRILSLMRHEGSIYSTIPYRIHLILSPRPELRCQYRIRSSNQKATTSHSLSLGSIVTMWGPGGVSCIIRFICHIPTGMMGISGLSTYTQLASLGDIYDNIPHGKAFLEGMSFIGYAV